MPEGPHERRRLARPSRARVVAAIAALGAATIVAACSKDGPRAAHAPESNAPPDAASVGGSSEGSSSRATAPPVHREPPKNGNVIVLSIDSLRADMPWNGYARPIAPRLTEVEKKAVDYKHAYAISSYTSMSLGGFLGGRIPSELRRSGYFFGTYRGDVFFPKLLQRAGVHTMGVMAHMYFKSAGFDQGFDVWKIVPGVTWDPNTDRDITSPKHEEVSEELLGDPANDSRPFFFWAHFLDPHDQYNKHEGIDWGKTSRDRYDGEVTFTDRYVGKLLDFIATRSWAARTTIVITADHGEEFGEHGMTRHGFEVWNTLVHVPLMILAPGAEPRAIDADRSTLDLAPTILELMGLPAEPAFEGKSLVPEIYGAEVEDRDVVVDLPATSDNGRRRAVVHGSKKIICWDTNRACKLFDLDQDPLEHAPITKGPDFKDMKARYDAATKATHEVTPYACAADCLNSGYRKK
jgi:arylsulfatase A-like enzyme